MSGGDDTYEVNIAGLQLLQAVLDRHVQALGAVARVIGHGRAVRAHLEVGSKLGGDDHLVTVAALLHPLSNPLLGLLHEALETCIVSGFPSQWLFWLTSFW